MSVSHLLDVPNTQVVMIDRLEVPLNALASGPVQSLDHHLQPWIAKRCGISVDDVVTYAIDRRSMDARQKPRLKYVYNVAVRVREDCPVREDVGVEVRTDPLTYDDGLWHLSLRPEGLPKHPIIVGTGPAGIMAAYLLAAYGCEPIILDRGRDADTRTADLETFHAKRTLDPDSNYLYGEGGAGTYSDGKLYTRAKDRRMRFLLEAFVEARAPRHILFRHHPHIGSDLLPHMCKRLRQRIEGWGGRFQWNAHVVDIVEKQGRCAGVELSTGERIEGPMVLMAIGHSARDVIVRLAKRGIAHRAKGFQMGCRIEHDQQLIDAGQYACLLPKHLLGAAEYNLVSRPPTRQVGSVTTFCMCPGGEILCATSEPNQLSTNGMSRFARASGFANAGLIVNQAVDYDGDGLAGFDLIERIEKSAFAAGGSDYTCPAQRCASFLRAEAGPQVTQSSYQLGVRPGRIDQLLPKDTVTAIGAALKHFERVIPGFLTRGSLVGVETRVSSPVRFDRDEATLASSLPGLYMGGEGAGYAGGIVSAGLDGLRLAETILTGIPAKRERVAAVAGE